MDMIVICLYHSGRLWGEDAGLDGGVICNRFQQWLSYTPLMTSNFIR